MIGHDVIQDLGLDGVIEAAYTVHFDGSGRLKVGCGVEGYETWWFPFVLKTKLFSQDRQHGIAVKAILFFGDDEAVGEAVCCRARRYGQKCEWSWCFFQCIRI
ncbi:MAG: hypothetical protein DCC55_32875 [Chloroflexi bacterium]|nr:MAG: hypothetical protein DCC55_32875 [Chloroflexota bacterium]